MMQLQLALDGTLDNSLTILGQTRPYIDIAEIGTPLILREGVRALHVVRSQFPDLPLLADFKIMDAGREEATIAFENGASIVTVMGFAQDATMAGVVTAAAHYGREVMVDLMQHPDPAGRIHECIAMGCDYFCVHTAHDVRRRDSPFEMLRSLRYAMPDAALAVAGGINLDSIDAIVSVHPAVIVVGSAITGADDPTGMARTLSNRIKGNG
jgi:3-hexulose-6-phosphate synthase